MPLSEENKIIELKYAAKKFGEMSVDERSLSAKKVILMIHVVTGWTIPVSELMDILVDQFQEKLNEKYANVNEKEFEYAFRNRGLDIKDWGRSLNLTLIDEIMVPYLDERFDLSRQEEQIMNKPLQIEQKQELSNEDWEDWIKDIRGYTLELIPTSCYEYLLREAKLAPTTAEKRKYMQRAVPIYSMSIQEDIRAWNEFMRQKQSNEITGKHLDSLITFSKRLIVYDYLKANP